MKLESSLRPKFAKFLHIIGTVLLQDMRGRFNTGSYFGYLVAIARPLSQLLILNPLEIIVEWMRSAYFTTIDVDLSSKALVLYVGVICLALGLAG